MPTLIGKKTRYTSRMPKKADSWKIAIVQQSCSADCSANLEASLTGIENAAKQGAELVILVELHRSLYFCQTESVDHFDLAETIPGPTTERLCQQAKRCGVVIVGSLFERRAPGLYHNTAIVCERDGSLAGMYRKMHIPDDPAYYEKFYFTPGDLGFKPISTSVGRLGVLVCWDQWFPEAARLMALAGAELLIYPTAIGWCEEDEPAEQKRQQDAWITIQRAHAIANGIPVAVANRVGFEAATGAPSAVSSPGIKFWGASFIAGPQGEIIASAPGEKAQVLLGEISRSRSEHVRRIWPYLRDRRIDEYSDLSLRYRDVPIV